MGAVYTYFNQRKAQSSGLSPSPTDDTGQKVPAPATEVTDNEIKPCVQVVEEKPPEQPESNDTSYGVEATAVRTLAASTGTVAILGTTAKVKEPNDINSEGSHEQLATDEGQCPSISVTEPESEETEAKDDTNVEQVGLEEKTDQSSTKDLKDAEPLHDIQHYNENKSEVVQPVKSEEIISLPQKDLESTESPENAALQALESSLPKEDQKENILENETEDREADQPLNNKDHEPEENKEHVQTSPTESPEIEPVQEPQAVGDVESVPLHKEEAKTLIKEPVRIVDYQEKKEISQQLKLEEKGLEETTKTEGDTKSEISENVVDLTREETPERPTNICDKEEVIPDDIKMPSESEVVTPDDSKTEEDNDISSEQLKTNSLSDMSLSEVLNSEGEEAAREAAKAQELQEMVASLSATANRTLDYEIPASDSSSNSKDFLHNDVILAASTSDSNGSDILPELPAHFSALTETQPKLLKDSRNRVEQTEQPEIEAKSVKDLEKEPEQLKESLDKSHEGKTGEQKDTTMPAVSKEIYEESKIVQEEGQDLKNENKKEEKTDEKHESVQHPQVVEETKEPKEEPESKREQEKVQDLKPELDKHQGSQEKVQEYVKQTTEEQKNEENQIKITELEQLNVQELQGGQVQIPELKLDESKDLDAEEETQTVHENSRGPKEGPEEIQKPKEDEEIIQMPTKNQEEINKPDEEREKLMKPEEYLEELNEGQPDTKEQIKEHNTVSGPEKTETSRELSIEQQAPEPEKKKEHVELPENDEPQYEDGSILPDKKLPSLTLNEENYTPEAPTLESPSDNSEPKSNGSNDESKQTEESKLSDKEEITELGVSDDNSIKEKDDGNSASDGKGSESSSIKEDLKSIEINEEYNAVNEKIKSAANADSLNLAATTIQSGFRGFKARKQLKEDTKVEEEGTKSTDKESIPDKQTNKDVGENDTEESKNQESSVEHQNDELGVNLTDGKNQTDDSKSITVPEPLMKIAQAEVDRICQEAEKATESLMTPPPMIEDSDVRETDQEDSEDFPAPPDDLMDSIGKNEITKDHDSSGTQSTEPTVPLGSNTDGDSSKTEDTTAPSLAESEIKSTEPTPSHNNDDNKLESSFTENVNTEVAVNRDSTEGELTMEEDSKEEELSSVLHSSKEHELDENKEEKKAGLPDGSKDKAAVIIQAGYRGFKTRKELKNVTDNGEASPEEEEKDEISNQQEISSEKKDIVSPQVSNKDSDSEIKDENSSTSKSEEELNESAKKIQAGIRGYLVRKDQKVKRDAAVKIQSHFRGFKTRQRLKEESS